MLYVPAIDMYCVVAIPTIQPLVVDETDPVAVFVTTNMTTHTTESQEVSLFHQTQYNVSMEVTLEEYGQYNYELVYKGEVVGKGLLQCGNLNGEYVQHNSRNTVTVYEPTNEDSDE